MVRSLFLHLVRHPDLFLEHASAYAELASSEVDEWGQRWKQRALLKLCALLLVVLGAGLGGVAGLVWAAVPLDQMPRPWLLWAIPLAFLVLAASLACWVRCTERPVAFAALRAQAALDLATLRLLEKES